MRAEALRALYTDSDVVAYVCTGATPCDIGVSARGLEVTPLSLGEATSALALSGIKVEPQRKGRQYFTNIFVREQCRYRPIFSGDTSLSGVTLLPQQVNGFHLLRAYERGSALGWKEYDYAYDTAIRYYRLRRTRCFQANDLGTAVAAGCN